MQIYLNDIIYSLSTALDVVEKGVVGAEPDHSKRIAFISAELARTLGVPDKDIILLAFAAALHDNALTEYVKDLEDVKKTGKHVTLGDHCTMGEKNVSVLPFYSSIKDAVLYHHEEADGSGPFGLKEDETPIMAKIIHFGDQIDVKFNLGAISEEKYKDVCSYIKEKTGTEFDKATAETFLNTFTFEKICEMNRIGITKLLNESLPDYKVDYTPEKTKAICEVFAKIIDYKSKFTSHHSIGIAEKSQKMAKLWNLSEEKATELYVACALHDIGKLTISEDVLEKPGKLTKDEYSYIKSHAYKTYELLKNIRGFEEITKWASYHHEKLDGSGYPFGKKGDELDKISRLLACLDIYQALVESRPYKDGMPHEKAITILREMGEENKLDKDIIHDIDICFA